MQVKRENNPICHRTGNVYVFGSADPIERTAEVHNLVGNAWTPLADIPLPEAEYDRGNRACIVVEEQIYI